MKTAWIPEHPRIALYRAKVPTYEGKLGELENLVTADASAALQFATKEECEAWIRANPHPIFVAREHGWYYYE
jgi:hypothetical protein